ncbi:MAG: amidohydrolase family protein [Tahibacter sp.]
MRMQCRFAGLLILVTGGAAAESVERSQVLLLGQPAGSQEARYADDGSVSVHYEYNDRGRGPKLDATRSVAADGTLSGGDTHGNNYFKGEVKETLSREGDALAWKNSAESEKRALSAPAFYLNLDGVPEDGVLLARALLKAPGNQLALLPAGEARIAKLLTETVKGKDGSKKVSLYAISGLGLLPDYLWLDEQQRFFATYSSWSSQIRVGYEKSLAQIGAVQDKQERQLAVERARALTSRLPETLVIRNARVFDPPSGRVVDQQVVVIRHGKIESVGPTGDAPLPDSSETIDAAGQFLMPGLWDMHAHYQGGADGPLDLASGVTTIRDLANDVKALADHITQIEAGDDIGPRIIRAGIIDGRGPYQGPIKVLADTEAEARAAVDMYARTGHEQIKIYSSIKPELMPVIAKYAHEKGLRVSGHVPAFMTARQFVDNGADEIQHINMLFLNFMFDKVQDTRSPARFTAVAQNAANIDLSSAEVRDFIALLKRRNIVIDPTAVAFEGMFLDRAKRPGPTYAAVIDRLPPTWQRQMRSGAGGLPVEAAQESLYRDSYQRMIEMIGMLHRSGVRIVAGTDDVAGLSLPRELELYVSAGIPPMDVLTLATYGSAGVMKRDQSYGRVAPGYVADLILVDGDPTVNIADIRKVRTTIRGDRRFDADALFHAVSVQPAKRNAP